MEIQLYRFLHSICHTVIFWFGTFFNDYLANKKSTLNIIFLMENCQILSKITFCQRRNLCELESLLTVSRHAQPQAFLQSAILASVSIDTIHDAVFVSWALIVYNRGLRPPKEPFASLASYHAVVNATTFVTTHLARYDLNLG